MFSHLERINHPYDRLDRVADALGQILSRLNSHGIHRTHGPQHPLVFGFRPHHSHLFGPESVCTVEEIVQKGPGDDGKNTQRRVVVGFSVGSVDSVAIWGGAEGPLSSVDRLPEIPGRTFFCAMRRGWTP